MSALAELPSAVASTPPPTPGRRDRKKLATRRALLLAALDLVGERGLSNVTVEDIAEAADVSTRTFFNYFPTKEAAVLGDDPEARERLRAQVLARPAAEPPLAALRAVLVPATARLAGEADDLGEGRATWLRRLRIVHADLHLRAAYSARSFATERLAAEALAERTSAAELDPYPALVAATALAATRVAVVTWASSGGDASLEDLLSSNFDALAGGLAPARSAGGAPRRGAVGRAGRGGHR